ncbi:MAG: VOC family protein, partial [Candidatus Methanoplasma sp.]|nr:VOC family protein [Candidatus Methanoplasma sp.]
REDSEAVVRRGSAVVLIKKGSVFGDSGIFFGVNDPYALHRRLIDEGVVFVRDPTRGPMGVFTSFLDPDGNTLHAIGIESPRP